MNQDILNGIQGNPEIMQSVQMAVQELLQDPDIDRESVEQIIRMIEFVLQNPDSYDEFRQTVVQGELLDAEDLPDQFNAEMLTVVLLALKVVQQQMADGGPGFARGGLNKIAQMGRRGDSELAHITPFEGRLLQAYGGSGGMNPYTDMPEYSLRRRLKKVFQKIAPVLPVVLNFVAPGLGGAIGSALSGGALAAKSLGAGILGSAAIGGLSSAAAGGNVLQGALGGALGAGAGGALGGAVSDATGMALGKTAQNVIGSSLIGGAQGAISGQGFGAGALQGATGGYLGSTLGGAASGIGGKVGAGLQTAGQQFGNALTMGATPQDALAQGALSGLAAAYAAPSDVALESMRKGVNENTQIWDPEQQGYRFVNQSEIPGAPTQPRPMTTDSKVWDPELGEMRNVKAYEIGPNQGVNTVQSPLSAIQASTQPAAKQTAPANKGFSVGNAAAMLPLLSMFSGAQTPEEIQQVVSTMSPEQREYFSRPLRTWNWDMLDAAAKMEGIPIGNYIALNWDKVGGGAFDKPEEEEKPKLARGGALNRVAYLASGGGTGRSDSIDAKLSDGEYVMDAETVALIGDGSTNAGARRLDQMRSKIRQHKGKSMARGKFSANAKSPLAYLKGA